MVAHNLLRCQVQVVVQLLSQCSTMLSYYPQGPYGLFAKIGGHFSSWGNVSLPKNNCMDLRDAHCNPTVVPD